MSVSPAVRKCSKCQNELPLTSEYFYRKTSEVGGFRYSCKSCEKKSDLTFNARYYSNNRTKVAKRVNERRRKIASLIYDHKSKHACKCGVSNPTVLDFHHRNASSKIFCIGSVLKTGWSFDRISEEITKCDLLCANCHRKTDNSCLNCQRTEQLQYIHQYKLQHPCKCGEADPRALDFHHHDPSTKSFNIGRVSRRPVSMQLLLDEINKCVILCANCHRIHHSIEVEHLKKVPHD